MYNGNKIKELLKERDISNKQLVEYMGWRGNGQLYHVVDPVSANPTARILERIADFFQVPVDTFFDRDVPVSPHRTGMPGSSPIESLKREIEYLQSLCDEKDKRLELQQQLIDMYAQKGGQI